MTRVLIVEHDADSRQALAELLASWGFHVEEAANGVDALVKAVRCRPDVAIVDLSMPRLDGYAVATALETASDDRPLLVALTGHGEPGVAERALAAGFDVFALKPWDVVTMRSVLEDPGAVRRRVRAERDAS